MNESRQPQGAGGGSDGGTGPHAPWDGRRWGGAGLQPALAERLLDGGEVPGADPSTARLAALLAAARDAPPMRSQDEAVVLAAFRSARCAGIAPRAHGPTPAFGPRRGALRGPRSMRMLVGGAAAVLTLGGVAIAAQGGLPHPFSPAGVTGTPSAPASSVAPDGTTPGTSAGTTAGSGTPASPSAQQAQIPGAASASPDAADVRRTKRMCEKYGRAERDGTSVDRGVLARLTRQAGGEAGIDGYCAAFTATPSPGGDGTGAATDDGTGGGSGSSPGSGSGSGSGGDSNGDSGGGQNDDRRPAATTPPASVAASPSIGPSPSAESQASAGPHGQATPTVPADSTTPAAPAERGPAG